MNKKEKKIPNFDSWCYAIVNNRLAEIFFYSQTKEIVAHAYIDKDSFTKKEKVMIEKDTKKCVFSYKGGKYVNKAIKKR